MGGEPALPRGFLFDPNRCTGCAACSLACSTENELGWGASWRQIVSWNAERRPDAPAFHLSLACNHCGDAPCVAHCPTGAMRRDPVTGAVLVDATRCIGCRYCAWVCPYDAPRFDAAQGVMTKCTLCHHRLAAGAPPACVTACPTDALGYGPLAGQERIEGFPEAPFRPRIRFAPLRRGATPPESTWSLPPEVLAAYGPGAGRSGMAPPGEAVPAGVTDAGGGRPVAGASGPSPVRLTFAGEWPLWLFTWGVALLVGWVGAAFVNASGVAAGVGAGYAPVPVGEGPASVFAFLGAAVALLGLSTLHLGRPFRAWRALTNLHTSALSREIAAVGAFLSVAALWLAWGGAGGTTLLPGAPRPGALAALGGAATLVGLVSLAAVDAVYRPVREGRALDSADTLLTGPMVAAALLPSAWLLGAMGTLKLAAAAVAAGTAGRGGAAHVAMRCVGLGAPLALLSWAPGEAGVAVVAVVAAVELLDRARFYRELELPGLAGRRRR